MEIERSILTLTTSTQEFRSLITFDVIFQVKREAEQFKGSVRQKKRKREVSPSTEDHQFIFDQEPTSEQIKKRKLEDQDAKVKTKKTKKEKKKKEKEESPTAVEKAKKGGKKKKKKKSSGETCFLFFNIF